mgnify:CR=1 FL=1
MRTLAGDLDATMTSDPQRVQAIFGDAVQKSDSERSVFLDQECAGDSGSMH